MSQLTSSSIITRNLGLDAEYDQLDGGGKLRIYDGTAPVGASPADTALSGNTMLIEHALNADAFAAASAGSKAANTIAAATAVASGTATFFRLYKSDGTTCTHQGTVGTSAANLIVGTTTITAAQSYVGPTLTAGMAASA